MTGNDIKPMFITKNNFYVKKLCISDKIMSEARRRFAQATSVLDILIAGIVSWCIKKLLDFVWRKGKTRLRVEGKTHLVFFTHLAFLKNDLTIFQNFFVGGQKKPYAYKLYFLRQILHRHRAFHQLYGNEPCSLCLAITSKRDILKKFVPEPRLYPPFKF